MKFQYVNLLKITTLEGFSVNDQFKIVGLLFDLSSDNSNIDGVNLGITLSEQIKFDSLTKVRQALYHYYLGNGWSTKRKLTISALQNSWDFNMLENGKEIYHFRKAISLDGFKQLSNERQCQVYTNLANLFNFLGRFVDAQEYWSKALQVAPDYPAALANRGNGLSYYGNYLSDKGHSNIFFFYSFQTAQSALKYADKLEPAAIKGLTELYNWLNANFISCRKNPLVKLNAYDLGKNNEATSYKKWCLGHQLYINPLNDLGAYSIASHDCLNLPTMALPFDQSPYHLTMFNQLKQEFGTARLLFYESQTSKKPHYADKDIVLVDTNESALYSLAIEKAKIAFRICYSIFDKIAFFLNAYLELKIPDTKVNFKTIWYKDQDYNKKILKQSILDSQNWALRGLFWLSKDLHWAWENGEIVIEPEARDIAIIRNHIEHKSFKIVADKNVSIFQYDESKDLSYSICRTDFEKKVLKILKLSRAAMIYLSLSVNQAEAKKNKNGSDSYPVNPGIIPFAKKK